jgi:hypothetical protein
MQITEEASAIHTIQVNLADDVTSCQNCRLTVPNKNYHEKSPRCKESIMNLINISSGAAIIVSGLVFIKGWSILLGTGKSSKRDWIIGLLTILLAVLGILLNGLYLSTNVALSTEFGVVLTKGSGATIAFYITLLGLLACLSLGWDLARVEADWPSGRRWIYTSAGIVWLLCLTPNSFTKVTAGGSNETPIYLFDIWWPPLVIWITIAFTDITLTILRACLTNWCYDAGYETKTLP